MGLRGRKTDRFRVLNHRKGGRKANGEYGDVYYFTLPPGAGEPIFQKRQLWDLEISEDGRRVVFTATPYKVGDRVPRD